MLVAGLMQSSKQRQWPTCSNMVREEREGRSDEKTGWNLHAVRHVLDFGGRAGAVLKANGVANLQQEAVVVRDGRSEKVQVSSSMPSVMYLMSVAGLMQSSKQRQWQW
jgi:hypothetical protein